MINNIKEDFKKEGKTKWIALALLAFIYPLGVLIALTTKAFSKNTKIALIGGFGVLFLFTLSGMADTKEQEKLAQEEMKKLDAYIIEGDIDGAKERLEAFIKVNVGSPLSGLAYDFDEIFDVSKLERTLAQMSDEEAAAIANGASNKNYFSNDISNRYFKLHLQQNLDKREQAVLAVAEKEKYERAEEAKEQRKKQLKKAFGYDGEHLGMRLWIKSIMKDPSSYEHISTSYEDKGSFLRVYTKYRGKNSFGAYVVEMAVGKCDIEGNVLEATNVKN